MLSAEVAGSTKRGICAEKIPRVTGKRGREARGPKKTREFTRINNNFPFKEGATQIEEWGLHARGKKGQQKSTKSGFFPLGTGGCIPN